MKGERACWRALSRFPAASGRWESLTRRFASPVVGEEAAWEAVRRWTPLSRTLIATPQSDRFLPPICIEQLANRAHRRVLWRQYATLGVTLFFVAAALVLLAFEGPTRRVEKLLTFFAVSLAYVAIDTFVFVRPRRRLIERCLFVQWILDGPKPLLWCYGGCMVVVAVLQFGLLQTRLGGLDALVTGYGIYFPAVDAGQWWRYGSGPFIHHDEFHWVSNLVVGALAWLVAGALADWTLMLWFLAMAIFPAVVMDLLPLAARPDALVGISGGVSGLFGWVIAVCVRQRAALPEYLWLWVLSFSLLTVGLTSLVQPNASSVGHAAAFVLGLALGAVGAGMQQLPSVPDGHGGQQDLSSV